MLILGIESSCDETAAAVLRDGRFILSNIIGSQVAVHRKYGGVVPELASRHHLENIVPIVNAALQEARVPQEAIGGIAVTQGPGLVGSLLVGVNYAKALAFTRKVPLVAVNHLEGHIYSVPLELTRSEVQRGVPETDWRDLFPALCLVVSGGHTSLYWVKTLEHPAKFELVGRTRDDAGRSDPIAWRRGGGGARCLCRAWRSRARPAHRVPAEHGAVPRRGGRRGGGAAAGRRRGGSERRVGSSISAKGETVGMPLKVAIASDRNAVWA